MPGLSGFLLINPRSGKGGPTPEELRDEAASRGIEARILGEDEDAAELARRADGVALGMAGGDGSLAQVAEVAIERDLPFACVPFGTRNHFARDLGLDRDDPLAALDAFRGTERRIDVGRVGERLFLNNVTFGVYASLVHRRESHRRRREAFARLRALLLTIANREPLGLVDEGLLHLYLAPGWRVSEWDERSSTSVTVDAARHRIRAAVDGEPAAFETPLAFSIQPLALRVLVPPAQS